MGIPTSTKPGAPSEPCPKRKALIMTHQEQPLPLAVPQLLACRVGTRRPTLHENIIMERSKRSNYCAEYQRCRDPCLVRSAATIEIPEFQDIVQKYLFSIGSLIRSMTRPRTCIRISTKETHATRAVP